MALAGSEIMPRHPSPFSDFSLSLSLDSSRPRASATTNLEIRFSSSFYFSFYTREDYFGNETKRNEILRREQQQAHPERFLSKKEEKEREEEEEEKRDRYFSFAINGRSIYFYILIDSR